ncbi:hypothetical protein P3W45_001090 [Vairimorpha bombi]|jgi:hypothetical protein
MIKQINFQNKLLSLDYNEEYIVIGDNKGFIYKYKDGIVSKIFYCDSPVSDVKIYQNDIFYITWDGDLFRNDRSVNLCLGIAKGILLHKELIYISIDLKVFVVSLDLEIVKIIDVPHKILCFGIADDKVICGMNLPILGWIDGIYNFFTRNISHETAILSIHTTKNLIYTGSVDGTVQRYEISKIFKKSDEKLIPEKILFKNDKWTRNIYNEFIFSAGEVVFCYNDGLYKELYSHKDDVMKVIKYKDKIFSIGLDSVMKIFTEEQVLDDELEEIRKLNELFN